MDLIIENLIKKINERKALFSRYGFNHDNDKGSIFMHPQTWHNILQYCIFKDLSFIDRFSFDQKFMNIRVYRSFDMEENVFEVS